MKLALRDNGSAFNLLLIASRDLPLRNNGTAFNLRMSDMDLQLRGNGNPFFLVMNDGVVGGSPFYGRMLMGVGV